MIRVPNRLHATMTEDQRIAFLEHLRETSLEATSAQLAGVYLSDVQEEYNRDEAFREEAQSVLELSVDRFEQEAIRRAVDGVSEPVFFQGDEVGGKKVYSDTLLKDILRARRPDKYGNKQEITGAGGAPLKVMVREFDD